MTSLLADMERFIHDAASDVPPLVKVALFGQWGLLRESLMVLGGYLKQHRSGSATVDGRPSVLTATGCPLASFRSVSPRWRSIAVRSLAVE